MPKVTTMHFNSSCEPITLADDFDDVRRTVASNRQTHDFVRVVGDKRSRVTILKASIAFVEEAEVVEPFVAFA
jgi:hypothetical protein